MRMPERVGCHRRMDGRLLLCSLLMVLPLLLLVLRLWQVQVLSGAEHLRRASRQSIRPVRLNPVRGRIYSADGELLVGNRSVYDVVFHPAEMRQPGVLRRTVEHLEASVGRVSAWLGREPEADAERLRRHLRQSPAMPLRVFSNLDEAELCRLWELTPWVAGMEVRPRLVRDYRLPGMMSQTLGFTALFRPDGDFAGSAFSRAYVTEETRGRSGLEAEYDRQLSGTPGIQLLRVDPVGYVHEELSGTVAATDGHDLLLTVDSRAQRIGEAALVGRRGALVVVDVRTGGVVAMVSSPGFDLATLTGKSYGEMNRDNENKPLLNRAVNAQYTPGSIVKPLVALAALESGAIDTEWRHDCVGYYRLGNHRIHCAKRSGHGLVDVFDAITVSCNPFFMAAGLKTGIEALSPMFAAAGFGERTGIDLPEFARGLCPAREVARQRLRRRWLPVDTAYCSMGQGLVLVTPLQMAVYCAAIANGGTLLRPHLVHEVRDADGSLIRRTAPTVRGHLPAGEFPMEVVRTAMRNAVESDQGSGKLLRDVRVTVPGEAEPRPVELAAKTGTAEVGSGAARTKETWMISYGPLPQPRYALACVVEDGDSGSRTVAPIVRDFWTRFLQALAEEGRPLSPEPGEGGGA